ncbi:MAG: hypothetical protein ACM3X3_05395 [Betaproteobacteria bacterium]
MKRRSRRLPAGGRRKRGRRGAGFLDSPGILRVYHFRTTAAAHANGIEPP